PARRRQPRPRRLHDHGREGPGDQQPVRRDGRPPRRRRPGHPTTPALTRSPSGPPPTAIHVTHRPHRPPPVPPHTHVDPAGRGPALHLCCRRAHRSDPHPVHGAAGRPDPWPEHLLRRATAAVVWSLLTVYCLDFFGVLASELEAGDGAASLP